MQIKDNQVTTVRSVEKDGYTALQVGGFIATDPQRVRVMCMRHIFLRDSVQQLNKPLLGQFLANNVTPVRELHEFRVSDNAVLPLGRRSF